MDNQKDNKKTTIDSYGHPNVSSSNALIHKPIYDFANKKTEKLVTALYMVTDCMDVDDALKGKLRLLGVELLSDMFKLSNLSPIDKGVQLSKSLSRITELLSFIDIACTIGFISEMNGSILNREFRNLIEELRSYQSKDTHFSFTLNDKMFEVERPSTNHTPAKESIKDTFDYKGQIIKRTYPTITQYDKSLLNISSNKGLNKNTYNAEDKKERSRKILSFIKSTPSDQSGLSIKDVSVVFTDCSEKTIQRELNSLVSKGQLRKIGEKRWSRYQAV